MAHVTILALAAATTFGVVATASAESGAYFTASLSYGHMSKADINGIDTDFGRQPGGYIATKPEFGGNVGVGYGLGNNWRAELELSHRRANYKRATAGALIDAKSDGGLRQTAVFANLYYDLPKVESGLSRALRPMSAAVWVGPISNGPMSRPTMPSNGSAMTAATIRQRRKSWSAFPMTCQGPRVSR